jgi:hypothetical protein
MLLSRRNISEYFFYIFLIQYQSRRHKFLILFLYINLDIKLYSIIDRLLFYSQYYLLNNLVQVRAIKKELYKYGPFIFSNRKDIIYSS